MGWVFSVRKYKAQHPGRAVTLPEEQLEKPWIPEEPKGDCQEPKGKISQVTEFLCVILLSDAEESKAKLLLDVDKGRHDMEI